MIQEDLPRTRSPPKKKSSNIIGDGIKKFDYNKIKKNNKEQINIERDANEVVRSNKKKKLFK